MVDDFMPCEECGGGGAHGTHNGRKIHCMTCQGTGLHPDELRHPEDTAQEDLPNKEKAGATVPKEKEHSPDSLLGQARDKFSLNMGKPQGNPIYTQTNTSGEPSFGFTPFAGTGTPMKNPAAEIFRRSNPMELAWRLLKMTPDEMRQQGFGAAAQEMDELKQQEQQAIQQGQATAPRQTAQTQSYQEQIDAMRQKQEESQRIRAMIKQGGRVGELRNAVEDFYLKHGHFPRVNKRHRRRLADFSRGDD